MLYEVITGFDIAHIGGRLPVASLIAFKDGNPDRKNYRMFRLRTTDGVIDDFASMREVTSRRYSRLMNEGADLPDLLLIDGGIGQVNAVKGVLEALGADIPIVGLAKRVITSYSIHYTKLYDQSFQELNRLRQALVGRFRAALSPANCFQAPVGVQSGLSGQPVYDVFHLYPFVAQKIIGA